MRKVRVRLNDKPSQADKVVEEIVRALKYAKSSSEDNRSRVREGLKAKTKFSFMITEEGIEVRAAYLCYRASCIATFDDLRARNFRGLYRAVDIACQRLSSEIKHLDAYSTVH